MSKLNLEVLKMVTLVAMVNSLGGNVTMKTFSQRSKAVERLNKLALEKGIKLDKVFDAGGDLLPPPPPETNPAEEVGEIKPAEKKAKKDKGPSIRAIAESLLLEVVALDEDKRKVGHSYEAILDKIKGQFEGAKTSIACLRWYAVHMRERGVMPPTRPRAKPVVTPAGE